MFNYFLRLASVLFLGSFLPTVCGANKNAVEIVSLNTPNYLIRHPNQAYIIINDQPKVENLRRQFPELYFSN